MKTNIGLYILTSSLLSNVDTVKFGMSLRLDARWFDYYTHFRKDLGYYRVYHLPTNLTDKHIKYLEGIILKKTKKYETEEMGSEYRKMDRDELDSLVRKLLVEYNLEYEVEEEPKYDHPERKINEDTEYVEEPFLPLPNRLPPVSSKMKINIEGREHQEETHKKLVEHYKTKDKALVVWACGGGKTILALYEIQHLKFKKIIIGVPSIHLLEHWENDAMKYFNHKILLVGGKGTTNRDYINKFYREHENVIIIVTYSSSKCLTELQFDFKIYDEAHHLCYKKEADENKGYRAIHSVFAGKQLSLTATLKDNDDEEYVSNYDEDTFGKIIDERSVSWMIERKHITDYNVIIPKITKEYLQEDEQLAALVNTTLSALVKAYNDSSEEEQEELSDTEFKDIAFQLVASASLTLMSIIKGHTSHNLTYCNKIIHAKLLSQILNNLAKTFGFDCNDIPFISHISSKMGMNERNTIINKFKKHKNAIITCVYIFGEGYDDSTIDGVVFVENMISVIRIIQSALRGNRKDPSRPNKKSNIIIPVILDDDDDFDNNNTPAFDKVRKIISEMSYTDESLVHKIKSFKLPKKSKGPKKTLDVIYNFDEEYNNQMNIKLINRSCLGKPINAIKKYVRDKNNKIFERTELSLLELIHSGSLIDSNETLIEFISNDESESIIKSIKQTNWIKWLFSKKLYEKIIESLYKWDEFIPKCHENSIFSASEYKEYKENFIGSDKKLPPYHYFGKGFYYENIGDSPSLTSILEQDVDIDIDM